MFVVFMLVSMIVTAVHRTVCVRVRARVRGIVVRFANVVSVAVWAVIVVVAVAVFGMPASKQDEREHGRNSEQGKQLHDIFSGGGTWVRFAMHVCHDQADESRHSPRVLQQG